MLQLNGEILTPALIEEGKPLLDKNWIQSGSFDPELPLDPDYEVYLRLQQLGKLQVYTLRNLIPPDKRELVGYAVYTFAPSAKHRGIRVAHGEAFYVEEEHRACAHHLLGFAEAHLKHLGVQRVGWFVVQDSAAYHFFHRQGFAPDEIVMEKVL